MRTATALRRALRHTTAALFFGASMTPLASPSDFASQWPAGFDRIWIGPEYFANRLQDWRLNDGRIECIESGPRLPVRTVHLLTNTVGGIGESLEVSITLGALDFEAEGAAPADASGRSFAGFLFGCGNDFIDYRLSAMTHHKPAEDGGLLAIVDDRGRVAFRDFSKGGGGGLWSIGGELEEGSLPDLTETRSGDGGTFRSLDLFLSVRRVADHSLMALTARHNGTVLSTATAVVNAEVIDGNLALVSHLGPRDGGAGYWFRDWRASGDLLRAHPGREFGPVLTAQHTLSRGTLKMTAQMGPLGPEDTQIAELQVQRDEKWSTVAVAELEELSATFAFRVEGWDSTRDHPYRICYLLRTGPDATRSCFFEGTVRAEPTADSFTLAAFTGHKIYTGGLQWNHGGIWFPHGELIAAVKAQRPDFLFFSGDQIYEGDLTPPQGGPMPRAFHDYLYKWQRWCWAFRDLTRDLPSVCIPDDHDVFHGNIWGAGGKAAVGKQGLRAQDAGGYKKSPEFVNAVHRTQTSHLPDPVDPAPVEQGISVYYTRVEYAGISFGVIADRQWKSSPTMMLPEGKVVNGWFKNPDFNPAIMGDVEGAVLLGERQQLFLRDWAVDYSDGAWMKVLLSQTILANVATLPPPANNDGVTPTLPIPEVGEYPEGELMVTDCDSNGWPQSGRNLAIRSIRRGFALHIAGDQHLGSTIQYGVDAWRDAGFALCVPSVANTFPRRWFPPEPGLRRTPDSPRYSGDYRDGFGNLITVFAVSNPHVSGKPPERLHDRAPGYGIVRFERASRTIEIANWPRWVDPATEGAAPYPGWPVTLQQEDNYGRKAFGWLPTFTWSRDENPVFQIVNEASDEIVYALRGNDGSFQPRVFEPGSYTIRYGNPESGFKTLTGLTPIADSRQAETIDLD